jgi:hypothetical protein
MRHCIVWWKFTSGQEESTASILGSEKKSNKQVGKLKQEALNSFEIAVILWMR